MKVSKANKGTICTLVALTVGEQNWQVRHILRKSLGLSVAARRKRGRMMFEVRQIKTSIYHINISKMIITTQHINKGDAFVQYQHKRPITFMVINEVDESNEYVDVCKVSWYSWYSHGINIQRRFPMAARDGKFFDFTPIPRRLFKEAVRLMRECDAAMKAMDESEKEAKKAKYTSCRRKLVRMIKPFITINS